MEASQGDVGREGSAAGSAMSSLAPSWSHVQLGTEPSRDAGVRVSGSAPPNPGHAGAEQHPLEENSTSELRNALTCFS